MGRLGDCVVSPARGDITGPPTFLQTAISLAVGVRQ